MVLSISEKVLKQDLGTKKINKYFIIDFCETAGISRTVFYKQYKNAAGLFTSVLVLQLKRALRNPRNKPINRLVYDLLLKMYQNKQFYINIYNIVTNPNEFHTTLKKEIANSLEGYMRPKGPFSVRKIELVAEGVYAVIFHWVANDFKEDIRDIYQCINLFLPVIEEYLKNDR
ncbi:TetR-like C-terminal domain-containing protein [Lactobacillus sp. ESL0791]|uniref:TetR-like C-terminal domain-containing protein n=1 Tax=Lactobacillus sp. ESL0791 TaxID=2983234 RepID=UPI0023F9F004|nr:TetR-like C-terminal domain-containing protein [Lactobacillus sp. ESL0791]MDF7638489.1 TetR-like C-terminal domain-containing protein [Lactobacillus sp. ESL0791]